MRVVLLSVLAGSLLLQANAQSGRANRDFSEASFRLRIDRKADSETTNTMNGEEIRIETDLVIVPIRISQLGDAPIGNLRKEDFRIYENGREQTLSYFAGIDEPFTVALLIDTSYSTVFKIEELKQSARAFIRQLAPADRAAIIAFDERPRVLLRPSTNRLAAELAIDSISTGSGTSLYDAIAQAFLQIADFRGRKAIVLLTDGVDTTSQLSNANRLRETLSEEDVIIYTIRYDTFRDVDQLRRKNAEIHYDDDDKKIIVPKPPQSGERELDYKAAREFLFSLADYTGGKVFEARRVRDLSRIFSEIADELRKTYIIGYYPSDGRDEAKEYTLRIRILQPKLRIDAPRSLRRR